MMAAVRPLALQARETRKTGNAAISVSEPANDVRAAVERTVERELPLPRRITESPGSPGPLDFQREILMPDNSFDIVSKIDLPEVGNAVQQTIKEVQQRFDLKDSRSSIELREKENKIFLASQDEFKLKAVTDVLQAKLVKRSVPLKGLTYGTITPAGGSTVRQEITLQQGIIVEKARDIEGHKSKKKVQVRSRATLYGCAKDRDTLQEIIALLKGHD
jgi:uncharacterized protein YajQ (UPF0234 family)